ncbi:MAG: hypothetical protein EBS39_02955 [Gammaproteobacteria bacterium]|nr:hypothetical protein [Gammaproteobacteria bacterium]
MSPRTLAERVRIPAAALAALIAFTAMSSVAGAQAGGAVWPTDEFCGRAQSFVTLSNRRPTNLLQARHEGFVAAPVSVDPLQTQQHTVTDESTGSARTVSCKLVAAEALRAAYGPDAARTDSSCALVNRNTFSAVLASLSPQERARARFGQGKSVAFDRDEMMAAPADWYGPDEPATVDRRGTLRIVSHAWLGTDAGQAVHYCHFIAPDFARRLLLDASLALPATPVKR